MGQAVQADFAPVDATPFTGNPLLETYEAITGDDTAGGAGDRQFPPVGFSIEMFPEDNPFIVSNLTVSFRKMGNPVERLVDIQNCQLHGCTATPAAAGNDKKALFKQRTAAIRTAVPEAIQHERRF